MSRIKQIVIVGLLLAGILSYGAYAAPDQPTLNLLSEEEAMHLRLDENTKVISATVRGRHHGPRILVEFPALRLDAEGQEIAETDAEAKLITLFSEKEKVDMGKFEMEFRKGNRIVSLTDRMRPYITENRLDARHLLIPPGRFEIAIRIEDKQGRMAERSYLWVVRN
jgi:hypothetical protein